MHPDHGLEQLFTSADKWRSEAQALRVILLDCGLEEALKWGKPCYSHDGANICIIQRMKDFLALMFFKGALVEDADGLLVPQGPNSRSGYRATFTSVAQVNQAADSLRSCVQSAIDVERRGLKLEKPGQPDLPEELVSAFDDDPGFRAAFDALTPGRQRGYALHFSDARNAETRFRRINKYREAIFDGKGLHDR